MLIRLTRLVVGKLKAGIPSTTLIFENQYPSYNLFVPERSIHASATASNKKVDFGGVASLGKAGKKKLGKLGPTVEKKVMPVEEDPNKLVKYCCGSNIYKEGADVELKPDAEYPEWLWTLRTGKLPPLEEMDPETIAYWRRVHVMNMRKNNQLAKLKKF